MSDTVHHVMWYTVYDAKTDELVAAGTAAMCAAKLGYANAGSFASAVSHGLSGKHPACKYSTSAKRPAKCSETERKHYENRYRTKG